MSSEIERSNAIKNKVEDLLKFCLTKENTKKRNADMTSYKQECMNKYPEFHERYPTLFFLIIENPSTFPMYRLNELLNIKNLVDNNQISEKNANIALGQKYYNEFVKETVKNLDENK